MSIEKTEVEGVVLCDATASACKCAKPAQPEHEVHECDPTECTGSWSGDIDAGDFQVVRLPFPVKP